VVSLGDIVEAVVLSVDADNKRISLGMKQVEPNPWDTIKKKYRPGTIINGTVKNVTEFGIFIGTEEGVDGLVHISDLSWLRKVKHPAEIYKRGQEVEAVVLNVDADAERFSLGIKQLTEDPWKKEIPARYQPGTVVEGEVVSITNFGVFLKLEEDVEGLIHVSELAKGRVDDPHKFCNVKDKLKAVVVNLDPAEKKIGLSIKAIDQMQDDGNLAEYMKKQEGHTPQLGDVLKAKLGDAKMNLTQADEKKEEKE
jgi:small subunit ribosomal protein S1